MAVLSDDFIVIFFNKTTVRFHGLLYNRETCIEKTTSIKASLNGSFGDIFILVIQQSNL